MVVGWLFGGTCGIIISDGGGGEKGKRERKEREEKERKRRRKMMRCYGTSAIAHLLMIMATQIIRLLQLIYDGAYGGKN